MRRCLLPTRIGKRIAAVFRSLPLGLLLCWLPQPALATCPPESGVALQVLGSGGPVADDARAGSGYLLWRDGRARVLIDVGGGVFLRFGQSGARIEDLQLLALTHLHTDHAADLPALLKSGYFSARRRPLTLSAPAGNHLMPSLDIFLEALFDPGRGAFGYLSGFLDGSDGLFALEPVTVAADAAEPVQVWQQAGLTVRAVGVHHGPIPTLGYGIEVDGRRIAISGDQNLSTRHFAALARDADLLIMPMAIPEAAGEAAAGLHARPSAIGRFAAEVEARRLVLSHLMARSLRELDAQLERVRGHYPGPVTVAEDLACYVVEAS